MTPHELAEANQLARRLHGELRQIRGLLPLDEHGASAMSRALGVDRVTCQRVVSAAAKPDPGAEILVTLPGIEGLRQFMSGVRRRLGAAGPSDALAACDSAIDKFAAFLSEAGGSQRVLRQRLSAEDLLGEPGPDGVGPDGMGHDDVRTREAMFRAALGVTGRACDVSIVCNIIQPLAGNPKATTGARVRGLLGYSGRDNAVPLELYQTANLRGSGGDSGSGFGGGSGGGPAFLPLVSGKGEPALGDVLMSRFCSTPAPAITPRAFGASMSYVIDAPSGVSDIVTAYRPADPDPHPATLNPPIGEVWSMQNVAARHLIFDVFLHKEIARRCIPSLETHLWLPSSRGHASARWSTRIPGGPRLEVLGSAARLPRTQAYPRYTDMLAHAFDQLAWNPGEFIGYRCELQYPVWRTGYCMLFDFSGNEMG